MTFDAIKFEKSGGIARIILNRPDKLNSLTMAMHRELLAALDDIAADGECRVVLLTGAGRGFCAGQDLSDGDIVPGDKPVDLGSTIEEYYNPVVRKITALAVPVVCAVNGVAAGAGANIALACDIVLASRDAKFIQSFCKLGLVPDAGGTYVLPRLVGRARAAGLALLGTPLTADEAEAWGMIWKAVDADHLRAEADAMVEHFATQPTKGLGFIKKALRASSTNTLDQQLDLERDLQQAAGRTEDYREGVMAFFEKRAHNFTGQ